MKPTQYRALVIGSSGTLGKAFLQQLQQDPACVYAHGLSRHSDPAFDLEAPGVFHEVADHLKAKGPFDLILDATGVLSISGHGPEKRLEELDVERLQRYFAINAIGPLLLLSALRESLVRGPCWYGKLSARVGSITDNRLGGWYGYRASKAALNMLLQTANIEMRRRHPELRIVALQPGTVRSRLSEVFLRDDTPTIEPDQAARGLLQALWEHSPSDRAAFLDHQGQPIPW